VPEESKIFIVHGHDHAAANEIELSLNRHGLEAIVLHRQPDKGRTLIEKIEHYAANVAYVIIILTPDDTVIGSGPSLNEIPREEGRARQNVIFEWGYFVGKFGRERVCCIYKEGTVLPTDVSGVVYKPFRRSIDEVKYGLLEELKASGLKIL
jgi:predicted nucleotide-binding protein